MRKKVNSESIGDGWNKIMIEFKKFKDVYMIWDVMYDSIVMVYGWG